jgi:Do/DeqQ family serine protease
MAYLKNFWVMALVAIISAGSTVFFYSSFLENSKENGKSQPVPATTSPVQYVSYSNAGNPVDITYAAEISVNAVVHVMTKYERSSQPGGQIDPIFEFFFKDRGGSFQQQPRIGSGSGVVLSSDGYIVTNNHVIDGASEITVTLNDKRTFTGTLIGTDPSTDLALLKIETTGLPTLQIGNSDELKIGEWVLAVGNPFNLTSTVTAGIVSAKARNINVLNSDMKVESFIQTDAVVNPGNSGGALVNTKGELVGINTAIASQTGSYTGYSFAVPVSIMSKVVSDLKQFGVVQRALLGIVINDINADFAKEKNLNILEGVYVAEINHGSAAMEAGIQKGDIITHVNNVKVKSVSELQEQISRFSPGDKVSIQAIRENKNRGFEVTLKNKKGDTALLIIPEIKELGANLIPLSDEQKRRYGISSGVRVEKVEKGGKFAEAGITKGYIITKVNNQPINSVEDIENIVKNIKLGKSKTEEQALFLSGMNTNGKAAFYAVDIS